MGCINLIVGDRDLQNVTKVCVNIVNSIATFFKPAPPNNIIKNEIILTQYITKKEFKVLEKYEAVVWKELK